VLDRLNWIDALTFELGGERFRFVSKLRPGGVEDPPEDGFNLYKSQLILEEYDRALRGFEGPLERIVELGIFHGGSTAMFNELFEPSLLAAFDIKRRSLAPYFDQYVAGHPNIHVAWGVSQTAISEILAVVGAEPLDLVIDDASHFYEETVASFEGLFPLLRPGGLYVIEDWGWSWSPELAEDRWLSTRRSLSDILVDLGAALQTHPDAVAELTMLSSLLVVRRGSGPLPKLDLALDPYRRSNPRLNRWRRAVRTLPRGRGLSRLRNRVTRSPTA
jgi:hypothetical protein